LEKKLSDKVVAIHIKGRLKITPLKKTQQLLIGRERSPCQSRSQSPVFHATKGKKKRRETQQTGNKKSAIKKRQKDVGGKILLWKKSGRRGKDPRDTKQLKEKGLKQQARTGTSLDSIS